MWLSRMELIDRLNDYLDVPLVHPEGLDELDLREIVSARGVLAHGGRICSA